MRGVGHCECMALEENGGQGAGLPEGSAQWWRLVCRTPARSPAAHLPAPPRLGAAGASVTQHPEFSELLDWLMRPERAHVRLSIASVRTNTVTPQLAAALSAR